MLVAHIFDYRLPKIIIYTLYDNIVVCERYNGKYDSQVYYLATCVNACPKVPYELALKYYGYGVIFRSL